MVENSLIILHGRVPTEVACLSNYVDCWACNAMVLVATVTVPINCNTVYVKGRDGRRDLSGIPLISGTATSVYCNNQSPA